MSTPWWSDDERFLAALEDADRAYGEVPREFVEAGKEMFTWHDIDAELASLTYDSEVHEDLLAVTSRAEQAPLRALIFATPTLTIELEVNRDALLGQLVPLGTGTAEAHLVSGEVVRTVIDATGCFVFRPVPSETFRLLCRPSAGADVVTCWISL